MKPKSGNKSVAARKKVIVKKARRKLAVIRDKALDKDQSKPWVWQRAVPREA